MFLYNLYFDGNKTPQGTTCSYALTSQDNNIIFEETIPLDNDKTVPEAEYLGLINGIKKSIEYFIKNNVRLENVKLDIYGDSQLVIMQLKGKYECKKPNLRILRSQVKDLLSKISKYDFIWIPRDKNLVK
ncbi:MAG: ribonuclease HI family protein [Endomicrobia bacterium]|nr:ribonuclease HI family protein [Endomicrobiia bacterium]